MATKLDIRSYLNPMKPSWGEAGQREKLTGEIYTTEQREALLRSLRPGSIVEVVETFLLAKTTGRSDARKRDLLEVVDRIEESGALIKELSTGMMSNSTKHWRQMQARAFALIVSSARGKNSATNGRYSKGRPRKEYLPEQQAFISQIWFSRKYKTVVERMSVLASKGIRVKRNWLYRYLGTAENPLVKD